MGGTSFDVSLVRDGYIKFTRETWLGGQFTGPHDRPSAVDVKNIGAGGGSIAWIDAGGLLRVGPQSAGAQPGPACYARGGTRADGDRRGARARLYRPGLLPRRPDARSTSDAARDALGRESPSRSAWMSRRAAHAVLTIANEHMVGAIGDITINEGSTRASSLLVAGGGAGGMTMGRDRRRARL